MEIGEQANQLVECLKSYGSAAVAFSAGVDSTVVAAAAWRGLGDSAVAVTGVGPALAEGELEQARTLAKLIGIRHIEAATAEIEQTPYKANGPDRCFHCKTELYTHVAKVADELGLAAIANGANTDDLGDYRPGMKAAADFSVRSPLVECGINKQGVRELAQHWGLPVADKPASPCLASRLAYGVEVTPERLARVDAAEQFLRSFGVRELRVSVHHGELARIELAPEHLTWLVEPKIRESIVARLKELGFKHVSVDLTGFQSGSLNQLVQLERSSGACVDSHTKTEMV
ncbi:MAG: ATP-dependent sacrificial sulfur transferase LarE [Planctomycetota bacterium]